MIATSNSGRPSAPPRAEEPTPPAVGRQITPPPSIAALSVQLSKANLALGEVLSDLLAIEISCREMWLLDAEISHLRMLAAQLEQIEFECDQHGSYKPLGRRLRLAGDAADATQTRAAA